MQIVITIPVETILAILAFIAALLHHQQGLLLPTGSLLNFGQGLAGVVHHTIP